MQFLDNLVWKQLEPNNSDGRAERDDDLCPLTSVQTSVDNLSSFSLNSQADWGNLAVAAGLLVMQCSFPAPPSRQ